MGEEKKPIGRPRRVIDYELVYRLASNGCTNEEIASGIDFSDSGFRLRLKVDSDLLAAIQKGQRDGCRSLRFRQQEIALKGDRTMLIWLGKQRLGQADKQELGGPGQFDKAETLSDDVLLDVAGEKAKQIKRRTVPAGSTVISGKN